MPTAKQVVRDILDTLPDECSPDDISYHIYVRARMEEGLADLDAGRTVPHEQVMREAAEWLRQRQ
jgi:hypothetical protein